MARFEFVEQYKGAGLALPERKTSGSAGYDFQVAEDTIIFPTEVLMDDMWSYTLEKGFAEEDSQHGTIAHPVTLDEMASITKAAHTKPTLVPTGVKCKLDPNTYLELSVRSSCPLKYWLLLANGVGIIDSDYYNNPDNEGHIFFQIINLSPLPIILRKGEIIGQGIIKPFLKTDDDSAIIERTGGFGSTTK